MTDWSPFTAFQTGSSNHVHGKYTEPSPSEKEQRSHSLILLTSKCKGSTCLYVHFTYINYFQYLAFLSMRVPRVTLAAGVL